MHLNSAAASASVFSCLWRGDYTRETLAAPNGGGWSWLKYGALRALTGILFLLATVGVGLAAEVIPPSPKPYYFRDYAGVVRPDVAQGLNAKLEEFERQTSSQILAVVYPKMQSDSSVEDYTVRVAQAWGVGQQRTNNGAVLFVFVQNREMYLQVGYGLEGAIPDALAKRIIEDEIKPYFRNGDYSGGLTAGVNAILAAAKGEYQGSGRLFSEQQGGRRGRSGAGLFITILVIVILFSLFARAFGGGRAYSRRGYRRWGGGGWGGGLGGGGWGGGGGWSSGGGGWGGGGGFSGGGGSFGGGGAGGRW